MLKVKECQGPSSDGMGFDSSRSIGGGESNPMPSEDGQGQGSDHRCVNIMVFDQRKDLLGGLTTVYPVSSNISI